MNRTYHRKDQEKDLHTLVQKAVQGAMQQQKQHSKKRKAGSVHFVEEEGTAKMPSKTGEDDDDDKNNDSNTDFESLNLKTPELYNPDSDDDLYA
jgi:hypothetical protein